MEKFLPLLEEYLTSTSQANYIFSRGRIYNIYWTVHDIKPSAPRAAGSVGSLTPSGSRSLAPVPIITPAPIPQSDDPDYVWDVFYHRAGQFNEYDAAANIGTLYVNSDIP